MSEEAPDQQDLFLPLGWFAWENGPHGHPSWHARPPGTPDPRTYVHGDTKQEVADKAWMAHRKATAKKQ